jgi:hypothetical protein
MEGFEMKLKRHLNSLGVSRLYTVAGTVKIEQLKSSLSWRQTKAKLKDLKRAGLLTLKEATKNRLVLQWEPRVFPDEEIKIDALRTLGVVKHELTLAFRCQRDREKFARWLNRSELLSEERTAP